MPCVLLQQVEGLRAQLQQLESRLGTAQAALRQSSAKSPLKSQQLTGSLDLSTQQPSQSTQLAKRLHADSTQPPLATHGTAASIGISDMTTVPTTEVHSSSQPNAASQSGSYHLYGLCSEGMLASAILSQHALQNTNGQV